MEFVFLLTRFLILKIRKMKNIILSFAYLLFAGFVANAQNLTYNLHMKQPSNHYYQVEMEVDGWKQKELIVKMPVWTPGSYLVREFAKNVDLVKAFDENGKALDVQKINKNSWKIDTKKSKKIKINYEVYAFELTVRTSFLDQTHGFVAGAGVFMYIDALKNKAGKINVYPHQSFSKVTTALPKTAEGETADGKFGYTYKDYDQLADCPIEIGNQLEFDFDAAGVKHHVAIYGRGNHKVEELQKDMAKIVEAATNVFGENPNKEYTFIIHNVERGQGGLEHMNSTVLSVNRWTYQGNDYKKFLSLVAHEYFHLWNVKRIRPKQLGPFNYDEENYTDLLWVMEGFTSYYDELLLLRAGYYEQGEYLAKLNSSLNYVEGTYGSRVQPLAHASFDAWIKAYRPNENSRNTTMTYYTRGQLMAALFDAMIIYEYKGKKSLDDFMQILYKKYYKELDRGFTCSEFKKELEDFTKQNLDDFFKNHINGTEIPDYKVFFKRVGVDVEYTGKPKPDFGASYSQRGSSAVVTYVRRGSSAEKGGLSVNDEIISVDGVRVDASSLRELESTLDTGDEMAILVSRDNIMMDLEIIIEEYEQPSFILDLDSGSEAKLLRDFWLR